MKFVKLVQSFTATGGLVLALLQPSIAFSQVAKPLKRVTLAVGGVTVLNVGYAWLTMPLVLGYWKQEGYDVNVIPVPGSLQSVQQLVSGGIEFAQMSSGVVIQGDAMNNLDVRAIGANTTLDWSLAVQDGGPIRQFSDLKGKTIGIVSLASGGMPMLKALLKANGLDPDKDVSIVSVGAGAPALDALPSSRVAGLMFWETALVGFQNAGAKLRLFRNPEWSHFADFTLATTQRVIDNDPAMVEAIARGVAKASLFTSTNPECVRQLQWKYFPDSKPTGADESTLARNDLNLLKSVVKSLDDARRLGGGKVWGQVTPAGLGAMQDFLFDNKVITKKLPASDFVISSPGFFDRVNNFDHDAIVKQAINCAVN